MGHGEAPFPLPSLPPGANEIPRHIRINPRRPIDAHSLADQLGVTLTRVPWMHAAEIYSLPAATKIAGSQAYREGHIYGLDLSSAAAGRSDHAPHAALCSSS